MTPARRYLPISLKNPLILYPAGYPVHQDIMVDRIEKFRQIHVDRHRVALSDELFYLPDTIMGRSAGPETATRFRKTGSNIGPMTWAMACWISSIQHCWNTKRTFTAIRFRYLNSLNRRRDIGPFKMAERISGQHSRKVSGKSSTVIPSMPGAPLLARTCFQAMSNIFCRKYTFQ